VQARVYTDPAVFAAETVRIFARAWCYVGHESQVPQPGSFIRASIANRPLLMVRGDDGAIAVLHNRCPHRGALLVGERCGHATRLSTMFYPSASVQATSLQMRVIVPEAVDSTPIEVWTLRLAGAPDSLYRRTVTLANTVHSPSSVVKHDDVGAYVRVQRGLGGGDARVDIRRGRNFSSTAVSEAYIRNQYRAWCDYMAAA
jgi:hypothetical protein